MISFEITISLDAFRDQIDAAATRALGRDVSIDGKIELTPALWPALEIEGFRIANPRDWESGDFVRLARFRAQIGILPLFRRQIHIEEITAKSSTTCKKIPLCCSIINIAFNDSWKYHDHESKELQQ